MWRILYLVLLLLCVFTANSLPLTDTTSPLKLLDAKLYPKAKCLDGTQGGYYYSPASDPSNSTKWVFHLQGGGECLTEESCRPKLSQALGSSKYFTKSITPPQFTSGDPDENPTMHSWNRVFVPYCSQASLSAMPSFPASLPSLHITTQSLRTRTHPHP